MVVNPYLGVFIGSRYFISSFIKLKEYAESVASVQSEFMPPKMKACSLLTLMTAKEIKIQGTCELMKVMH